METHTGYRHPGGDERAGLPVVDAVRTYALSCLRQPARGDRVSAERAETESNDNETVRPRWRILKPGNSLMLPAYDCRLDEVPNWLAIIAACRSCHGGARVAKRYLERRFGEWKTFTEIEPQLRCMRCGSRGRNKFFLTVLPRD
jgi:hypothetical protein